MRLVSRCALIFMLGLISFFISLFHVHAQKIEPTRTLRESVKEMGTLTVSSEPPGLNVILDGTSLGNTPVTVEEIEPGSHVLHVRDADTEILILPGRSVLLSYYKGDFIEVLEEKKGTEREQKVKKGKTSKETEPSESTTEKRYDKPPSSLYWPDNPTGPIYPPQKQ
jgi:hypothetical protein